MLKNFCCGRKRKKEIDVVLEGGGVKAIALLGAITALMNRGYVIRKIAASSAGSIPALMYAIGYTPAEMKKFMGKTDFSKLPDDTPLLNAPIIGATIKLWRIWKHHGIYPGTKVYAWIEQILAGRATTFCELNVDFRVTAYDLENREVVIFSKKTHPHMKIADAVRMTTSYPFFFQPPSYFDPQANKTRTFIDGGFAENFPLGIFDNEKDKRGRPLTIGFKLVSHAKKDMVHGIGGSETSRSEKLIGFIIGMARLAVDNQERFHISRPEWNRIVPIDVGEISALDFNIGKEVAERLYETGFATTCAFLDNLEWEQSWLGKCSRKIPKFIKKIFGINGLT